MPWKKNRRKANLSRILLAITYLTCLIPTNQTQLHHHLTIIHPALWDRCQIKTHMLSHIKWSQALLRWKHLNHPNQNLLNQNTKNLLLPKRMTNARCALRPLSTLCWFRVVTWHYVTAVQCTSPKTARNARYAEWRLNQLCRHSKRNVHKIKFANYGNIDMKVKIEVLSWLSEILLLGCNIRSNLANLTVSWRARWNTHLSVSTEHN